MRSKIMYLIGVAFIIGSIAVKRIFDLQWLSNIMRVAFIILVFAGLYMDHKNGKGEE